MWSTFKGVSNLLGTDNVYQFGWYFSILNSLVAFTAVVKMHKTLSFWLNSMQLNASKGNLIDKAYKRQRFRSKR